MYSTSAIFSIITMICEDFKISGETDGKTVVCNSFPAMERGFYKIAEHKPEVLDDIKKHEIFDYIKNNIINSELNKIFNLNNIDWITIEKECEKSKVKEICDFWRKYIFLLFSRN